MLTSWKVLVISDTHGRITRAAMLIKALAAAIDAVYFLGDHIEDGEELSRMFPRLAFLSVAGNCDYGRKELSREVFVLAKPPDSYFTDCIRLFYLLFRNPKL